MGKWESTPKTHVASMTEGDFYANEKSVCIEGPCEARIEHVTASVKVLKESMPLKAGEVLDASFMSCKRLRAFCVAQIEDANKPGCHVFLAPQSYHDENL